ncbi:MAG: hypothetical protein LUG44_01150 [Clostridiales bacterium]|nr:hypothetical protein [Clostridiales bacterium]
MAIFSRKKELTTCPCDGLPSRLSVCPVLKKAGVPAPVSTFGVAVLVDGHKLDCVVDIGPVRDPDDDSFTLTYLYDNSTKDSDFRFLHSLSPSCSVTVTVCLPDGTEMEFDGYPETFVMEIKCSGPILAMLRVKYDNSPFFIRDPR